MLKNSIKTRTQYVFVGSDFSQQEPRCLSFMSQDQQMIDAYMHKKDLYATIAKGVYKNNYEDNLEATFDENGNQMFDEKGNPVINHAGKKRRNNCKSLLLGRPKCLAPLFRKK